MKYYSNHYNGGHYLWHNVYFRRTGYILFLSSDNYDSVEGSGLKLAGGTTNVTGESRYVNIWKNNVYDNERINLNIQGMYHMRVQENDITNQTSTSGNMAGIYLVEYNDYSCRYTDIINNYIADNKIT